MEGLQNKKSQLIGIGVMAVFITAAIAYILKDESIDNIVKAIHTVKPIYIIIGIILMFIYISCEGVNIWITMKTLKKKTTLLDCIKFAFVGFYFCSITPSASGGQPAQVYFMNRKGLSVTSSSLALLIILFAHQVVVVIYAIMALFMGPDLSVTHSTGFHILIGYGIIANASIFIGILLLIFYPKIVYKIINAIGKLSYRINIIKNKDKLKKKIEGAIEEYRNGARYMKENPKVLIYVTIITVFQVTVFFMIPYIIYIGFGLHKYNALDLIMAQAVLNIAVSSLPIPGAVGVSESIFVDMFRVFFGGLVIPGMLLTRIANFYVALIVSGMVSLYAYARR